MLLVVPAAFSADSAKIQLHVINLIKHISLVLRISSLQNTATQVSTKLTA